MMTVRFLVLLTLGTFVFGGGPRQRDVEGKPLTFNPDLPLFYHVEGGDLSPDFPNAVLRNLVREEFAKWGGVAGSRLTISEGTPINADINSLVGVLGALASGLNPVVFDEDGSILVSAGLSPSTEAAALQFGFDGQFHAQMVVVFSGPANQGKTEEELRFTILRYLGHALGLGNSVVNGDLFFQEEPDPILGRPPVELVEVLYPLDPGPGKTPSLKYGDIADLLRLYGSSEQGRSGLGAIQGTIFDATGAPSGGVNVIVRKRSNDASEAFSQAAASISDPLTGNFHIVGLEPGEYSVQVTDIARQNGGVFGDPIKTDFSGLPLDYLNLDNSRPEIIGGFPGAEEYYNGASESNDPYSDQPDEFTTVLVEANTTTRQIDVHFNYEKAAITRLLYPWVSNRSGDFEAVLIANNYGEAPVQATLTATRNLNEYQTITRIIPAGGFLREQASSLFPELGSGSGYSVLLSAASEKVRGSWVTNSLQAASGQSPSQGVAVRIPTDESITTARIGTRLVFGYLPLTDSLISAPVIVNTGNQPEDIRLRFFNAQGQELADSLLEAVPPWVPFASVANALVPEGTEAAMMIAESSGQRLTGVSFVFNTVFFETAIGNATAVPESSGNLGEVNLVYPWISNNTDVFESILIANNYSDQALTLTLTARRNTDPVQSQTISRTIPPQGFLNEAASSLFEALGSGPGYTVTLTSPSSEVTGQWVTNNLASASGLSPSQGVAVVQPGAEETPSVRSGQDILLGYLPVNEAFTSAPVIVNLGSEPQDVRLAFYRENGELVSESILEQLKPNLPVATLANGLLPENSGDVYLIARSSDAPISGVVFVFNADFFEPAIGNAVGIGLDRVAKTAFVNVNLVPMDQEQVLPGMTVLVEGDAITAVGPAADVQVPDDAQVIDGSGHYLMPGLSDAHSHVFEPGDFILYLANGVTSILSMGDSGYEINQWRREILAGERMGPSIYCGNFFRGVQDQAEPNLTVATVEQGRAHVRNTHAAGYDFVKVYSGLTTDIFNAVVDEANQLGIPFVGHIPRQPGLEQTLEAGLAMVAHSEEYWSSIFNFTVNPGLVQTAVDLTVDHGAFVTATMAVVEALPLYLGQNESGFQSMLTRPGVEYMDPKRLETWRFDFLTETADPGIAGARLPFMRDYTKALFDAGVPLLLGTDATVVGMVPGFSVYEEMLSLERVGLTPFQILQTATAHFGTFINGRVSGPGPFGTIHEGARADLLLLSANPLEDVDNTRWRVGVMARGRWYTEASLQQLLQDLAASYQTQ